jgi:phage-related tail fiber protein
MSEIRVYSPPKLVAPPTEPKHAARLEDVGGSGGGGQSDLPGTVKAFLLDAPPTGWLELNGATLSADDYPALFAQGFMADNGDGTFTLPDLRGGFLRGLDNGRGVDPDGTTRAVGSEQADALQNITGGFSPGVPDSYNSGVASASGAFFMSSNWIVWKYTGSGNFSSPGAAHFDASRVARTSIETRPRNVAVLYCIKF